MRRSDRNGFTLTELMVVLVIIGILAAVGIPTAVHFIRLAEFRKNEENAKTAFLAAESALTWYRSSGEWEDFREQVVTYGVPNNTFEEDAERNGRIYAVTINSDRAQEVSDSEAQGRALLEHGGYARDFFDAVITIEIDIETGRAYSAFYATRASSMAYDGTDADGVLNISAAGDNRSYENRKGRLLGYYSAEDVANVVELEPVRLKVATINLVNSETLSLNWTSNSRHDDLDVKFEIVFYDDKDQTVLFSTEVDRRSLPVEETAAGLARLQLKDGDGNRIGGEGAVWTFPLSYQTSGKGNGRFSLVLDGMMTARLMEAICAKDADDTLARNYSTSITRLGDAVPALKEPLDIYAQIRVEPTYGVQDGTFTEYRESSPVNSNVENTLFAKGSVVKDGDLAAQIGRFRHLSNIRYYDTESQATFTLAARNLDWASAGTGMYDASLEQEGGAGRTLSWKGNQQDGVMLDFPSIRLLSRQHTLAGNGSATLLSNLCLGKDSMPDDRVVESLYGGMGTGLDAASLERKKTHYLGLFGEVEGTVRDLVLHDPLLILASGEDLTGSVEDLDALYGVGILCGRSEGILRNVSIRSTESGSKARTLVVRLPWRETGDSADADAVRRPAGIGGLVGVLARVGNGSPTDGSVEEGRLAALTDKDRSVTENLTMQGSVSATLPRPAAVSSSEDPQERAKDHPYGIGGIFGHAVMENGVRVEGCRNEAYVTGNLFTGGIGGSLEGNFVSNAGAGGSAPADPDITYASITDCSNEGLVLCAPGYGHEDEEKELEGRYFGGILGYGDRVQISDSTSASGRSGHYTYDATEKEKVLLGQYVGGIIGYGRNSQLAGCSTQRGGYILGSDYVGGIAGGLSNDAQEAITGTASGVQVTTNAGYVIGNRYVGGIVGKNDGLSLTTITDCVNNGVAAGYERYIGGIVGYNGKNGQIRDCASYLSDYDGSLFHTIVDQWKATGDCAGGLAGYNNGKILFSDESQKVTVKSVSSIVVGKDYVGGVIGFNDTEGELDVHYTLIGGRVHAYGNGAGGCIGLNASPLILDQELAIRPSGVEGKYYVGGCIGANLVALSADTTMDGFRADNALGSVTGEAFTGGVIGYQRTYAPAQLAACSDPDNGSGSVLLDHLDLVEEQEEKDAGTLVAVGESVLGGSRDGQAAQTAGRLLPLLDANNVPTRVVRSQNAYTLTIGNRVNGSNNNIPISADLYVGGIVGYCERNSRLIIRDCVNSGNLSKRSQEEGGTGAGVSLGIYLASTEVNADAAELNGADIRVSIGGGIIGANLDNQVIDACVNTGTMNGFIGLGGIVGFNAGGVFACDLTDNFGNGGLDYIGGIAGLNVHSADAVGGNASDTGNALTSVEGYKGKYQYASGMISGCSTREGKNISGNSYVGGIVGYNLAEAQVYANVNGANVTASGDYVGGTAGANSGEVRVSEGGAQKRAECAITGNNGTGIGGIVGWNRQGGQIDVIKNAADTEAGTQDAVVAVDSHVTVNGRQKVGGIVGINEGALGATAGEGNSAPLYLVCRAKLVHATEGYAGGIIGEARVADPDMGETGSGASAAGAKISHAINRSGDVKADNGPAGGIVATNGQGLTVQDCQNLGNVGSDQGYAGGIAAENRGRIIRCIVGEEDGGKIVIRSVGVEEIGAVCGVNYGSILSSAPRANVSLAGTAKAVGGIAGRNASGGLIGKWSDGDATEGNHVFSHMPEVACTASGLTVGGIAGVNQQDGKIGEITVSDLEFREFDDYRYLGGIVGENQDGARVEDCGFTGGTIFQNADCAQGNCYGGIAGWNGGLLKGCEVENIYIDIKGVYTATSTSTAEKKEELSSHVGGIAGKNEEGAEITECLIKGSRSTIVAVSGMAGGVAGYNKGRISLSGDGVTASLMQKDGTRINDVQTLVANAQEQDIRADATYVAWTNNGPIEDQHYNGSTGTVSAGRSLSLVMSGNGNLGGITAYNAPEGEVSHCATGNWFLNNKSAAIGVGTGGIIGMNESRKDLSFLLNQAFVGRQLADAATDRFAGGIIGNQNNITNNDWYIRDCVNFGTVYCRNTHYSGGILGQWTGRGGTVERCYNFGNLQTTYGTGWVGASGGIVAQLYHAYENNEYNIIGCGNHGNIYGRNGRDVNNCANDSAGILGNVTTYRVDREANAQKFTINVLDCVNGAGVEIYSNSMASGIVGFFSCNDPNGSVVGPSTANIVLHIERCRNYASTLNGSNYIAGIFGERYGATGSSNTTLKHCFSVDRAASGSGSYNKTSFPIISFATAQGVPGNINPGSGSTVYNFFLSDLAVQSFQSGSFRVDAAGTGLERANARRVYSFMKNGTRYFVHLENTGGNRSYTVNGLTIAGTEYRDPVTYQGKEVGHVLFATRPEDSAGYADMESVVTRGSGYDYFHNFDMTYVRPFCFAQAGMLLAPESVVLVKTDTGEFAVEVHSSAFSPEDVTYIATLYRRVDGKDGKVGFQEIASEQIVQETADPDKAAFRFDTDKITFRLSAQEAAKGGELFVRLKACEKGDPGKESSEVDSNLVPLSDTLPDPGLRIELIGDSANGHQYRFRMEEEQADKTVHVKLMDGTELEFQGDDNARQDLAADSLQQLVVWVTDDAGVSSSQASVPVYLPAYTPEIALKGPGNTATPKAEISGTGLEDLRIMVTLEGKGGNVTTPPVYRADLIGTWRDAAGKEYRETVFQSADILTSASGAATATFMDLPACIADATEIKVRAWYAESGLGPVYTYYDFPDGDIPAGKTANIHTLVPTEAADGTVTAEWKEAYSPVLEGSTFENYRWISETLFDWLNAPHLMELQEGESLMPETDPATGHLQYTFTWDQNGEYDPSKDIYTVSLTGISRDAEGRVTRVSLLDGQEVKENQITVDAEDWTCQEVELTVGRKGSTTGTPKTIGLSSADIYPVKRRLPTPAQPRVTDPDINELKYQIEWDGVRPEADWDTDPAAPTYGCDSYGIYVQAYKEDGTLEDARLIAEKKVLENGRPTLEDGVYRLTVDLEKAEDLEQQGSPAENYAGRRVLIYVKALARDGDPEYVHSLDGITYALDVPSRIGMPQITWSRNWEHEKEDDQVKTVDSFQDGGLQVTVTAKDDASIPPGGSSYLMKAYVFDNETDAEKAQSAIAMGDTSVAASAIATYPSLRDGELIPVQMDAEDTKEYSHALSGLSAEYAGKYILFCARISSGEGNVSSSWVASREVWQLPFVQLPTPEVSVGNADRDVEVTLITNPDLDDAGEPGGTKTEEGLREEEPAEGSPTEEGPAEEGSVEEGPAEEGSVEEGPAEEGSVEEGPAEEGDSVEEGPTGTVPSPEGEEETAPGEDEKDPGEDPGAEGTKTEPSGSETPSLEEGGTSTGAGADSQKELPAEGEGSPEKESQTGYTVPATTGQGTTKEEGIPSGEGTASDGLSADIRKTTARDPRHPGDPGAAARPGLIRPVVTEVGKSAALYASRRAAGTEFSILSLTAAGGEAAQEVEEKKTWTAEHTALSWNSVAYADSYYITFTTKEDATMEYKIVENGSGVSVYQKNGSTWDALTGQDDRFILSGYHKNVEGQYEQATDFRVPYRVDLQASLEVGRQGDGFRYTLILPDAARLVPKDGGNDLSGDELRFTGKVSVCSDVEINENAPGSDAYVRSQPYEVTFN